MANWAQITMTARGTSRHGQDLGCQTCNNPEAKVNGSDGPAENKRDAVTFGQFMRLVCVLLWATGVVG